MSDFVQFGAGLRGPEEWINFDSSPTLRLQRLPLVGTLFNNVGPKFDRTVRYGDIIKGLPVADGSCRAIYCSHVLEHLSLDDFRIALANTYKYLSTNGRFRFVLPDLEHLAKNYLNNSEPNAAIIFMKGTRLGYQSRRKGLNGVLRASFGNTAHLWMWDFKSISAELSQVGFTNIRRAKFGDSGDSMFDAIEDRVRWDSCLGVDCIKPES